MGIKWEATVDKQPKHNQWVTIYWRGQYINGQYDAKHPFGPLVIDRVSGAWWSSFDHWFGLKPPAKVPANGNS